MEFCLQEEDNDYDRPTVTENRHSLVRRIKLPPSRSPWGGKDESNRREGNNPHQLRQAAQVWRPHGKKMSHVWRFFLKLDPSLKIGQNVDCL